MTFAGTAGRTSHGGRPTGAAPGGYLGQILVIPCFLMIISVIGIVDRVTAEEVTEAQARSGLYRAYQAWRNRIIPLDSINGRSDTLSSYAAKCDAATGITVPGFSCSNGVEVPGQGAPGDPKCDRPNVLNNMCDPGSKFQVLPGRTSDAVAVAHCRKVGLPVSGDQYNDIAVIQYNKRNGALCFYQALGSPTEGTTLPGEGIPQPHDGDTAPWQDGRSHWIDPQGTQSIGCTGCHDNGGFIRSEYLAQLVAPPNALPSTADGFDNLDSPARYVGLDYASNRSWRIRTDLFGGDHNIPAEPVPLALPAIAWRCRTEWPSVG